MKKEKGKDELDFGAFCVVGVLCLMLVGVLYSVINLQTLKKEITSKQNEIVYDGFFYDDSWRGSTMIECIKLEEHKGQTKIKYVYFVGKREFFFNELWLDNEDYYPYPDKEQVGRMYKQYCKDAEKQDRNYTVDGVIYAANCDDDIVTSVTWNSMECGGGEDVLDEQLTICGKVTLTK
jgi:hypothetical protein